MKKITFISILLFVFLALSGTCTWLLSSYHPSTPWIPLVVEKLVSTHSKNLTGFWIMPDTGFSFEDADLQ